MLMKDESDSTSGRETILDYELSWVLRMAAKPDCSEQLKHQCRHILFTLINEKDADVEIEEVKTWKQWEKVDLIADIYLVRNGVKELHVLLVEDKAYTLMTEHQRDDYPKLVKDAYNKLECYKSYQRKYILHQALVTCYDKDDSNYKKLADFISCNNSEWKLFSIEELIEGVELTGSDLFDEFWIKSW